jgi:hypothetical protein
MEDYSEYESVDENEGEQETKNATKGDKDSANKGGSKSKQSLEKAPKNKALKKGQSSLANFFVTPKIGTK